MTIISFIRRIVLFAVVLSVAYLVVLLAAVNSGQRVRAVCKAHTNLAFDVARPGSSTLIRFREIKEYRDIDILFLGSSHTYRSFDPRFFSERGFTTFNMGSTAQSPLNSYFLLRPEIERLNPKLVVFEVFYEVLVSDGLESYLDLYENMTWDSSMWKMAWATTNVRAINVALAHYLEIGRTPMGWLPANLDRQDTYIRGGYVETVEGFEGERGVSPHRVEIRDTQLDYLARVISLCKGRGTKIVLVVQPLPEETLASMTNLTEVQGQLAIFARDREVTLLDFNTMMKLDSKEHFFDSHHLNQEGVRVFDHRLFEELQRSPQTFPL